MIAILGKGFISYLISSTNQNLQLLSFQKIYTLLGFYETCDRETTTSRGCHLEYTDTLNTWSSGMITQSGLIYWSISADLKPGYLM